MDRINWIQILVLGLVVMLIVLIGLSLLPMLFGGGYGGMGPGMMGRGMMGGWCPSCGGKLIGGRFPGLLFILLNLLIPLGLLALLIVGGVWLARNVGGARATAASAPLPPCPNCDQPVASDWRNCPYCGEEL